MVLKNGKGSLSLFKPPFPFLHLKYIDFLTEECEKGDTIIRQSIKILQEKDIPVIAAKNGKKLMYSIDLEQLEQLFGEQLV